MTLIRYVLVEVSSSEVTTRETSLIEPITRDSTIVLMEGVTVAVPIFIVAVAEVGTAWKEISATEEGTPTV